MELKIVNETLEVRETILEGSPEQGFECDILLPDYCPDVCRILKCHAIPKISQCYQNGDKVNVDGFINAKIYYLCEENKIHCYDAKLPFSKTLDLKETQENVSISVGATTNYVNCRAVNQRRLDVRGAISLKTRITGSAKQEIVADAAGDGVRMRKKKMNTSRLCSEAVAQFSVQEEQTVSGDAIKTILRSEATVMLTDVKIIPNKAIIKGEMKVTTVYTEMQEVAPKTVVYTFPVSRIMDIDFLTNESKLLLNTDVVSLDVVQKQNEDGEFTKLVFDVKVNIFAKCYEEKEITFATDTYSTLFGCNYNTVDIRAEQIKTVIDETFTFRTQLQLETVEIDKVLDLWCFAKSSMTTVKNSKISTEIPVDVFTFYQTENGLADFVESRVCVPFEHSLKIENDEVFFDPEVKILSCDYNLVDKNKIELRFEVYISGAVFSSQSQNCVSEISLDYSSSRKNDETPALTIYYSESGEEIWDIAKRYNTCPECIKNENSLDCEVIDDPRVILIPIAN